MKSEGFFIFFLSTILEIVWCSELKNSPCAINYESFSVKNINQLRSRVKNASSKIEDLEQSIMSDIKGMDRDINIEINNCNEIIRLYKNHRGWLENYCADPRKDTLASFVKESNSGKMIDKTSDAFLQTYNFLQLHEELDAKKAKLNHLIENKNQLERTCEFFQNRSGGGGSFEPSLL